MLGECWEQQERRKLPLVSEVRKEREIRKKKEGRVVFCCLLCVSMSRVTKVGKG